MTNIIKHPNEPLTYLVDIEENFNSIYQLVSIEFIPNAIENSAQIVLNLEEDSSTPSIFKHTFYQSFNGFNGEKNIRILISMKTTDGKVITHKETGTHIKKPFKRIKS